MKYERTTTASRRKAKGIRYAWIGGTYNAGRNASKRRNRQADIRARVAARSKR